MKTMITLAMLAAGAIGCYLTSSVAQTPPVLDRIEEDWELVIGIPDTQANGPQITCTMSPSGDLTASPFVAFDLNYREYPTTRLVACRFRCGRTSSF